MKPNLKISVPLICTLGAVFALALPIAAFGQTTADDFSNRGVVKQGKGDLDGAIADYSRSIELNPKSANTYYNRGGAKAAKGDLEGAIADYSRSIELNPKFAIAYNNRGDAKVAKGDLEGAIADYSRSIELNPKFAIAYNNRGKARQAKGDLDAAMADYNRAIELYPEYADAYNNRGKAKQAKGDLDGAKGDYSRALPAVQPIVADPHSPDGRFSVDVQDNPSGNQWDLTDKVIVLRAGEKMIGKKISGGNNWKAFWDKAGKYVAATNHEGSAGGETWVFSLSDGKCITDSDLVDKATKAFKRLDSRITDKMLVKCIVEFKGWTKGGVLKFEVYTRYLTRGSKNDGQSHGEEAQFTYDGNMKVEGSKLVLVAGKVKEGHRIW